MILMKLKNIRKPLIITSVICITVVGTVIYLNKKKPGFVLGATTSAKDFIEEKIPQSKPILDKIIPDEYPLFEEEVLGTSDKNGENNSNETEALREENTFLKESLEMTKQQLETLTKKSNEVKDHLLNLSDEIKNASESTPIHEKALEYGQYVYCQQVVKEYEK